MIVLGPVVAGPTAVVLGAPLARLRGVTGGLAKQNAIRSPRRTAGSATALMVGVGVVVLLAVVAASLKASISDQASEAFGGDLAVTASTGSHSGFSPNLATEITRLPQVDSAVGLGSANVLVNGSQQAVRVADPARLDQVLHLDMTAGTLAGLRGDQLAVSQTVANSKGWHTSSPVTISFADGAVSSMTVGAIYRASAVVGGYLLPQATVAAHDPQSLDQSVLIRLRNGGDVAAAKAAVTRIAHTYGVLNVQDRNEFAKAQASSMDTLLNMVYVILALAIIIALLGIANTLSLSTYERTRELGLLRAVGASRSQIRSMVRLESVIIALFGTAGGLFFGLFVGWALARAVEKSNTGTAAFSAPISQLVVVVVVGGIVGVLAAIRPARRAARMNVLDAIAAP
jgi:putative ABC transport system permease protein